MRGPKRAFTLIELLVVIAIIALLLSVILPSLKKAKELAAGVVCTSNQGQLMKAWLLYAGDNDEFFIDGDTGGLTRPGHRNEGGGRFTLCWVGAPMNPTGGGRNQTLDDKIRGFEAGGLWPYVNAPKAYHCPADKRHLKPAVAGPGFGIGGYRTYSIGNVLSQRPMGTLNSGEDRARISKTTEFVNPAGKVVFIEETEKEGWNKYTWCMDLTRPQWVDPFAVLHTDSSAFGFADGHAERHKWVDKQTIKMAEAQEKRWSAVDPDTKSTADYDWFKSAYIPGRRPDGI